MSLPTDGAMRAHFLELRASFRIAEAHGTDILSKSRSGREGASGFDPVKCARRSSPPASSSLYSTRLVMKVTPYMFPATLIRVANPVVGKFKAPMLRNIAVTAPTCTMAACQHSKLLSITIEARRIRIRASSSSASPFPSRRRRICWPLCEVSRTRSY